MNDNDYMKIALQLAKKGDSRTEPNPKVGCVIVKDGVIIGEGYHKIAGEGHAEVNAVKNAEDMGYSVKDSICYVTLEPCSHYGKTPPCADMLVNKGIKKLVCAMEDPNPKVSGRGFQKLRDAGVEVLSGIMEEEARFLNRTFFKTLNMDRPYVFLKAGISLDGKIQTSIGESKWITSEKSRKESNKFRSYVGAIAVGIATVLADNPRLTARYNDENIDPYAVVFDSGLKIPLDAKLFERNSKTIIFTTNPDLEKLKILESRNNVEVYKVKEDDGKVSITEALKILREKNIISLLVEGGGTLNSAFLKIQAVDELMLYFAPIIIGGNAKSFVAGEGIRHLNEAVRFSLYESETIDGDLFLRYIREE